MAGWPRGQRLALTTAGPVHDVKWGDPGVYGEPSRGTPDLDQMGAEGVLLHSQPPVLTMKVALVPHPCPSARASAPPTGPGVLTHLPHGAAGDILDVPAPPVPAAVSAKPSGPEASVPLPET